MAILLNGADLMIKERKDSFYLEKETYLKEKKEEANL